jgi:hypothetical protein
MSEVEGCPNLPPSNLVWRGHSCPRRLTSVPLIEQKMAGPAKKAQSCLTSTHPHSASLSASAARSYARRNHLNLPFYVTRDEISLSPCN